MPVCSIFICMKNFPIKENGFEGAPGGGGGTSGYQTGYGTFASPDVMQNPNHFEGSNANKTVGQNSNTTKDVPNPNDTRAKLNAIYSKKDVPSPDEVVTGFKYELGQQIKKDRRVAKDKVLDNLLKDPHFYGDLKMLNIDDESMVNNMNESKHPNDPAKRLQVNTKKDETKKIFAELAKGKDNKYVVNSGIVDVMKQMWEQKKARNAWRD